MRVLYSSESYTPHDKRFLSKMTEFCDEVFFLNLSNAEITDCDLFSKVKTLKWKQQPLNETYTTFTPLSIKERISEYRRIINSVKPDLIHAGPVQTCGYLTALVDFHPFIIMSWGSDLLVDSELNSDYKHATRFALGSSDYFICDCQAVLDKANEYFNHSLNKTLILPWGVEIDCFMDKNINLLPRNELKWNDNFVIITNRKWTYLHGVPLLLKAFRMAYQHNSNIRLLMLGDGPLQELIRRYIKANNLENIVYMTGNVNRSDLVKYYCSADIYISCSHVDGTSVSLLEAMAVGLPVIVSDIPSNREWINHEKNGWLANVGDERSFKNIILHAAKKKNCFNDMGRYNRSLIIKKANWHKNANKLLNVYEQLILCKSKRQSTNV